MTDCLRCRYYYITWDKSFPYGCKAIGFKSQESPSAVVFKSSGIACLMFESKETGKSPMHSENNTSKTISKRSPDTDS